MVMVAAISEESASTTPHNNPKTTSQQHQQQEQEEDNDNNNNTNLENSRRRPPLLPSEKDSNGSNNGVNNQRRPRSRQVSSRYLSPSPSTSTTTTTTSSSSSSATSSRRFPSPLVSRSTNFTPSSATPLPGLAAPKRSQSVDRRRPVASSPDSRAGNVGEVLGVSAASKLLFTSTRSLSVSFQGEAFSLPISKAKAPNSSSVRKGTPERRRATPLRGKVEGNGVVVVGGGDHVENSRPLDQRRWPGKTRQANPLSKSVDCSVDRKKFIGSDILGSGRSLQQSLIDESSRVVSFDGRLSLDLSNAELLKAVQHNADGNLATEPSDLTASDTDSVSSGSTSGMQEYGGGGGVAPGRRTTGPRGIVVSARFWQETNSRLRRLQDPGSPLSTSPGSRMVGPPKGLQSKRFSSDSPLSSPRTMPSPIRGAMRPASPSKLFTPSVSSPSRGNFSPSRVRNVMAGNLNSNSSEAPSILSFSGDLRRGKIGENRIVDAHLLRLLYNRHLQWRFVNARADAACLLQKRSAEKHLWNAWITISELRRSVTVKRTKLLLLRQKLKLSSILKGQMTYLEEWALLDREHSSSLVAATEALKANTLRLPIVGKAVADIQSLKDAIGSAVDVMQAMGSSICSLLSKVEEVNSLMSELVNVTAKEQASLNQCEDFLCTVATMQVKDCSLRTHVLQLNRVPTTGSLTTRV